ncbi:MAG: polyprenyl synthetase family protein [Actinomycetia bacterium]|nr:polyprenyl synthetase family protein [Actinomycetes bacterium]
MNALATIRSTPGLECYLERLEARLEAAVASHPGLLAHVAAESLAAGGKRLRPALTYLTVAERYRDDDRCVSAGAAVELVHMASLVHDDMLDKADLRRGQPTIWVAYGRETAKGVGDYLFACAFAELARTRDMGSLQALADATLALVRGEALQRRQAFDPDTEVEAYLLRASLKTGKLFEAACVLGGGVGLGAFGEALGIAFQITDDILDCTGDFDTTGKAAGVDLRDGTPTLPLILAARKDSAVACALAGQHIEDALERVALTGALDESRVVARDYADRARAALHGRPNIEPLEALAYAVVDREH